MDRFKGKEGETKLEMESERKREMERWKKGSIVDGWTKKKIKRWKEGKDI